MGGLITFRLGRKLRPALFALALSSGVALTYQAAPAADGFDGARAEQRPVAADALPQPLSQSDAEHYRRIFAFEREGDWSSADAEIGQLNDRLLMGHVLALRLMHPKLYRANYAELGNWLALYRDHPEAPDIYALALRRKPAKEPAPERPGGAYLSGIGTDYGVEGANPPREALNLGDADAHKAQVLKSRVRAHIRSGWPTGAKQILESAEAHRLLDSIEYDEARTDVAAGYFAYGKDEEALAEAEEIARHAGAKLPQAHWIAGIAAWRMGDPVLASRHFEAVTKSRYASRWDIAAAAFWAARASLVTRKPAEVSHWLAVAGATGRSFYGMLARRALGMDSDLDWTAPAFDSTALDRVLAAPGSKRALALLQVGERGRAEAELRKIYAGADPDLADAIYGLALRGDFPALAMRIGVEIARNTAHAPDAALYPVPNWTPAGGYKVDRALLFAVIRQESRFDSGAKSWAGARGVMQIMPGTARFLASYDTDDDPEGANDLYDPESNIAMGQKYLAHLLEDDTVQNNLFLLVAAYNGGPAKVAEWRRKIADNGDPLLFLESIPSRETRTFVERVLANMWIYQQHLGQPSPALDAVVSGEWPIYKPQDRSDLNVAQK